MRLVLDTSALIAVVDANDRHHGRVRDALDTERRHGAAFLLPALVLCEVEYVLRRENLARAIPALVGDVLSGAYRLECPVPQDLERALAILGRWDVGLTDATVAALAERSGNRVATLDHRDFRRLRTANGKPFELVP